MALQKSAVLENDVVVLCEAIGRWPAGTTGTVVSDYGDTKLLEISDAYGVTLDFIQAGVAQLSVHWRPSRR